jgi:hypothetical protein
MNHALYVSLMPHFFIQWVLVPLFPDPEEDYFGDPASTRRSRSLAFAGEPTDSTLNRSMTQFQCRVIWISHHIAALRKQYLNRVMKCRGIFSQFGYCSSLTSRITINYQMTATLWDISTQPIEFFFECGLVHPT